MSLDGLCWEESKYSYFPNHLAHVLLDPWCLGGENGTLLLKNYLITKMTVYLSIKISYFWLSAVELCDNISTLKKKKKADMEFQKYLLGFSVNIRAQVTLTYV